MTAPPTLNAKARREAEPFFTSVAITVLLILAGLCFWASETTTRLEAIAASLAVIEANTDRGREP